MSDNPYPNKASKVPSWSFPPSEGTWHFKCPQCGNAVTDVGFYQDDGELWCRECGLKQAREEEEEKTMHYQGSIVEQPTEEQRKEGAEERIVLDVTSVTAQDDLSAAAKLGQLCKEPLSCRAKVTVRPFA
jgi:predicted nucleic acid-binding Zn ribbon protein